MIILASQIVFYRRYFWTRKYQTCTSPAYNLFFLFEPLPYGNTLFNHTTHRRAVAHGGRTVTAGLHLVDLYYTQRGVNFDFRTGKPHLIACVYRIIFRVLFENTTGHRERTQQKI